MKKKTLLCLLGGAIGGALVYYFYTMFKVKDIEDDTLEPDDDSEDDFVYDDDDLDFDYDASQPSDTHKIVQFNDIEKDDVFQQNSPLQEDEGEDVGLEETDESIISNTPINIIDYDTSYFELVCNVSREEAIKLILKERDTYTEDQLQCLTNSELADIYSEIINN